MKNTHLIIGIALAGGYLLWRRNKRKSATNEVKAPTQATGSMPKPTPKPIIDDRFPKADGETCPEGFEFLKLKCNTPPCPSGGCIKKVNI